MCRFALTIAFLIGLIPALSGQDQGRQASRKISLVLPSGVASETVQINYFMTGPFGGYAGWVKPETKRTAYEIDTSVEGCPTKNIEVIAWLPGCEIVTLNIPIWDDRIERSLPCKTLGSVVMNGQIFPISLLREQPAEIQVEYLAEWGDRFFGVYDGPVPTFQIAKVVPDEEGKFQVKLPDLSKQTNLGEGGFNFILRHKTTLNIIAFLKPTENVAETGLLKVHPDYPGIVQFAARR